LLPENPYSAVVYFLAEVLDCFSNKTSIR